MTAHSMNVGGRLFQSCQVRDYICRLLFSHALQQAFRHQRYWLRLLTLDLITLNLLRLAGGKFEGDGSITGIDDEAALHPAILQGDDPGLVAFGDDLLKAGAGFRGFAHASGAPLPCLNPGRNRGRCR